MRLFLANSSNSNIVDHMFFNIVNISIQSQNILGSNMIFQSVLVSCLISVAMIGNALVIISFVIEKNLRTPSNLFILNLAIGDFFTATFVLPVYMKTYIIDGRWLLGNTFCKINLTVVCTLCQCTIYNIVLISFDRFMAVTKAVKYRDQQNNLKLAFIKMAAVWIVAFLIFGPAVLIWDIVVGYSAMPKDECLPEFFYNSNYLLYSSVFDFFIPMTAIAFFNISIYYNISCRIRSKITKKSTNINNTSSECAKEHICVIDTKYDISNDTSPLPPQAQSKKHKLNIFRYILTICQGHSKHQRKRDETIEKPSVTQTNYAVQDATLARDRKMATSLAVLVCTFCICWSPSAVVTVTREVFCKICIIPPFINKAAVWLFFFNSSINPFIYPLCHPAFKKTLMQLLCLKQTA